MPVFGRVSTSKLDTAHPLLQELFNTVIKKFDISINCGHRTEAEQNALSSSNTNVAWPNSMHNKSPSWAVDWLPYPLKSWDEELIEARFANIGGYIQGVAERLGIQIRVGYDWDTDGNLKEHSLRDFPHVELVSEERLSTNNPTKELNLLTERIKAKDEELTRLGAKLEQIKEIIVQ